MIKTIPTLLLTFLILGCSNSEENNKSIDADIVQKVIPKEESVEKKSVELKKEVNAQKLVATIKTLEGKKIHVHEAENGLTFEEYKDKSVFLIFFGYRCPPCLKEMPALIGFMNKKHPDVEIIAIEAQGLDAQKLKEFKVRKGINYTLGTGSENNDFMSYIAPKAQWGGSIPFFIAFDKKGVVKTMYTGALNASQLDEIYKSLSPEK